MQTKMNRIYGFLVLLFFASLPFHLRINNTVFIVLIVFWFLSAQWKHLPKMFQNNTLVWAMIALFFVNVYGLFNTTNMDLAWFNLDKKLQLVLFPFFLGTYFVNIEGKKALLSFVVATLASSIYCLIAALILFFQEGNSEVLFYHQLSNQIGNSAIYQSLYVLWTAVIVAHWYLKKETLQYFSRKWMLPSLLFLSVFLVLLSSKSLILLGLILLSFSLLRHLPFSWPKKIASIAILLFALTAFISQTPIADRFKDVFSSKLELIQQDSFTYRSDFDGLNMRLTFWRFAFEILEEDEAWIFGVGPGDSQTRLVEKYKAHGIYLGNPNLGDAGYQKTNTHNQFVETSLKSGIVGLMVTLGLFALLLLEGYKTKNILQICFGLIFMWLMLTESVFERQKGLSLFCAGVLLLGATVRKNNVLEGKS